MFLIKLVLPLEAQLNHLSFNFASLLGSIFIYTIIVVCILRKSQQKDGKMITINSTKKTACITTFSLFNDANFSDIPPKNRFSGRIVKQLNHLTVLIISITFLNF